MLKNKTLILTSLGGAAIAAGVWYYFSKRNITAIQRYENLFKSYEKEFFLSAQMPLTTQIQFDQLFELATYDENDKSMAYDRMQYQGEPILNQGSVYYDCYDCSPIRQELIKTKKIAESNQIYLVICEDCFDASKHRGHTFEKVVENGFSQFRCFCGNSCLMDEKGFCDSHQGFNKSRDIALQQKSEQPILWKGIEKFLLDSFYMVFKRMSDLLMKKSSGKSFNTKETDEIGRLNIYLTQIIAKINEIMELNPPSIYNISQIFELKLQRPISLLQIKKNEQSHKYNEIYLPVFSNKKQINKDISIFEYILIFYQFINDSNDSLLNTLFSNLNLVNEEFNLFLIEKSFKYISLTIREDKLDYSSESTDINSNALPSFVMILVEYVSHQKIFDHLLNTLGEEIFNPLDFLIKYLEIRPQVTAENDNILFLLLNVSFEMFRFVNQVKGLLTKIPYQTIEKLYAIAFTQFQRNSIMYTKNEHHDQRSYILKIYRQLVNTISCQQLEKHILYSFINLFEGLLLISDEQLISTILPLLCSAFQKYLFKARDFIDSIQIQNKEFKSLSIFFLTHLPILIALSERKMFSQEVLHSFLSKNFSFEDVSSKTDSDKISQESKTTRSYFIQTLQIVLDTYLYKYSYPSFLVELNYQADLQNSNFSQILTDTIDGKFQTFTSARQRIYDSYILTSSLIHLLDEVQFNNQSQPSKNIIIQYTNQVEFNQSYTNIGQYSLNEINHQIQQILFDPTPMLNMFSTSSHLYFPEQTNQEKNQYKSNITKYMVTMFQLINQDGIHQDDLVNYCEEFLNHPQMINQYINQVFQKNNLENEEQEDYVDNNKQQRLSLLPEFSNKCYFRPALRLNPLVMNYQIQQMNERHPEMQYAIIEADLQLNELFLYQFELIKKIYLNLDFQNKLNQIHQQLRNQIQDLNQTYLHVYVSLMLFKHKDIPELFTKEEIKQIEDLSTFYKKGNYNTYFNERLSIQLKSKQQFKNFAHTLPLISDMLDKLQNKIDE